MKILLSILLLLISLSSQAEPGWKVFAEFFLLDRAEVYCGKIKGDRDITKIFTNRKKIALSEVVDSGTYWCGVTYNMSAIGVPFESNPTELEPVLMTVGQGAEILVSSPKPPSNIQ